MKKKKNKFKDSNVVEIVSAIKTLANNKEIDITLLLEKVKEALQKGYNKFNPENTLLTEYDATAGSLTLSDLRTVVKKVTNSYLEIDLLAAQTLDKNAKLGATIKKPVFLSSYSYFAIQQVSQTIKKFLNLSDSNKIYKKFITKKGTILSGSIENIDYRYFSVDIGDIFAFIPKEEQIANEVLKIGNRIKFYVLDVFLNHHFGQVMGSRVAPEFLSKLFALEIPEVGSGSIVIKKTARVPGIRAKMAVYSNDFSVDPIGSCIGRAGVRIKNITRELNGEKIDVFLWNEDPHQFLINACSPSKVVSLEILANQQAKVVVLSAQYFSATGQDNVALELLNQLTGLEVKIFALEELAPTVKKIILNGNLSYSDLEKLEVSQEILTKCQEE